jgi:hypothetical protein
MFCPVFEPFGAGFKTDTAEVLWCRFPSIRCVVWVAESDRITEARWILPLGKLSFCPTPPAESWLLDARFLNPMTETARAAFLLAALFAKWICRDGRALTPVPERSASPRMMPKIQP